jgi:RND family efflux transporter MFP subunit
MRRLSLITLAIVVLACGKKEAPPAATTEAPPLPSDVSSVAAAATSSSATETTTTTTTGGVVQTATADAGRITATGEFVSPTRSELSAKITGRVAKVYVDQGSRVRRGQPLLEIESDYLRLNLERAAADAARAKAAADDARRDLERKKELIGKDSIPRATYDRSQAMYEQAQAAYQSAQAQASLLRRQIADATLRSPIDGVVAEKRADVGQRLGDNTVAFVVVQTSPLKLRFRVPERYLASIRKGDAVKASVDPYPNESFEGRVSVVGGVIDPGTRTLLVETEFANRDGRLKPGLFARVELAAK